MGKSYLKIALRILRKQKQYAFINITGLALGLLVFLLIALYVRYHLGFEAVHANADRLYRLVLDEEDEEESYVGSPGPAGPLLQAQLPEVEDYMRFVQASWDAKVIVSTGDRSHTEARFFLADPSIFRMFTVPVLKGDPATALTAPDHVVLTATTAAKYFGDEDPIGRTLTLQGTHVLTVVAVVQDPPPDTHLQFDFLAPFTNIERLFGAGALDFWPAYNYYTYLLLHEGADARAVAQRATEAVRRARGQAAGDATVFALQPLKAIHFEFRRGGLEVPVSRTNLYLFLTLGAFVLLIACINFMNLSTAKAMTRAREVGLRKVMGAGRRSLIGQFLGESFVMTLLALAAAAGLLFAVAPVVGALVGAPLAVDLFSAEAAVLFGALLLVVGLVSGSYPAFYLSAFEPARVLKGAAAGGRSGSLPRSVLVVFQFAVSTVLLVGVLVISRQFDYMGRMDLGFDREQVVTLPVYDTALRGRIEELKQALLRQEGIVGAAAGNFSPVQYTFVNGAAFEGQTEDDDLALWWTAVDHDFVDVLGMEVVEGRGFSRDFPTDATEAYLLNETAVRELGWDDPVGKRISLFGAGNMGRVIGVVKDFHYRSLHHGVPPFALKISRLASSQLNVRLAGRDLAAELEAVRRAWHQVAPDAPFEYRFLDEEFARMYQSEQQARQLLVAFLLFSLFIACLGLFGLTAYAVERRRKEIGIRKVLGASLPGLVALLAKEFVRLVAVAFVLAVPVAYVAMSRWLEGFAYRVDLTWPVFAAAGLAALAVAVATVSYQAARAALADPVESLRYE